MHENYRLLNEIYKVYLGRPIDLDGYNTYTQVMCNGSIDDVIDCINTSPESKLADSRKSIMHVIQEDATRICRSFKALVPLNQPTFHVVIVRYNEDYEWIHTLSTFQCEVYVYDRGDPVIGTFSSNVHIIQSANIGYEENAFATHMINHHVYYEDNPDIRVVFTQCGLDHNPHILHRLCEIDSFNDYESLHESIGGSVSWGGEDDMNDAYRILDRTMNDIGGGSDYMNELKQCLKTEATDMYAYMCDELCIHPMYVPVYSPCSTFCVRGHMIANVSTETLRRLLYRVDLVYVKSNPIISKVFASVLERLWVTFFSQGGIKY
jgi:hypothetical protein